MLDKPASTLRIRERLLESERLMEETGCYDGITELELRNQDPLKFETLHTKLRAYCVSAREMARRIFPEGEFVEIFVDTPLDVAEGRDPKGLYAKARSGALANFTGVDSPYEPPEHPDIRIDTIAMTPEEAAETILRAVL